VLRFLGILAFLVKNQTQEDILYISNVEPFLPYSCYPYTSVVFVLSYSVLYLYLVNTKEIIT